MAYYAALVSVMQLLEEIIHCHEIMKSLHEKFSLLLELLEDYSFKGDEADCLERRIRDAAYQAQDIIESQMHSEEDKSDGGMRIFGQWICTFQKSRPRPIQLEGNFSLDLEKVKEEVDSIVKQVIRIKESCITEALQQLDYDSADIGTSEQASTSRNTIVGFDELLMTIKDQLCGGSSKLQTIPIVGMGGIGKTTLARHIFDDDLIAYHFDVRLWVTVSQDYHIQKVLLGIRDSINQTTKEFSGLSEEELPERIYKYLKGRRYFIIMDDIWSTRVLEDVKRILPDDCNGSRIMLTTRLSDVAVYANTFGSLHQMEFLNEEQSWNLLREKVFGQEQCPPLLEVIGKLIANNCRGLPLAIVVVAGILYKLNRTPRDWKEIAQSVSSVVTETNDHFSKVLSLSYDHLPHHLKACILYIGCFPEDYEISISKLTKLWIAEGFVKPFESKSLEEVAKEYLEDLVRRNLVLITKKKTNGKFKNCSMHDLLRDLCTQRARSENFFHVIGESDYFNLLGIENKRGLYLCYSTRSSIRVYGSHDDFIPHYEYDMEYRKVLLFSLGFKLLRVLDTLQVHFSSFPIEIVQLFHLRYLAFDMYIEHAPFRLPPSISKLENLQTFIMVVGKMSGRRLEILLPYEIWKMPQLRHVMIHFLRLSPIPFAARIVGEVPILKNLQTLSTLRNFKFTKKILIMVPNLKKLKVSYTRNFPAMRIKSMWQKYCLNNLVYLHQLEKLSIWSILDNPLLHLDPLPENFAFPLSLKKLSLGGSRLPWKDITSVGSLPNLEVLILKQDSVVGEEWEPIEGEFPRLKFLLMDRLDLKYWRAENTHFPRLEHLKIRWCKKLEEIPLGIGEIPTLELIEVYGSKSAANSAMQMLEDQRDQGNDVLQVRV